MFTTNNREEAELLVTLACPTNMDGDYYAPELAQEQTIENLHAFSHRLADLYDRFIQKSQPEADGK